MSIWMSIYCGYGGLVVCVEFEVVVYYNVVFVVSNMDIIVVKVKVK